MRDIAMQKFRKSSGFVTSSISPIFVKKFMQICLHLGSNLGDRQAYLAQARQLLTDRIGPINRASSLYETDAWGKTDQPPFLNQSLLLDSDLPATTVLATCLRIETDMGRERTEKWGPRLIDIDLLFYGNEIIDSENLTVPHPHLAQRNFVLIPTMEIFGNFIHPIFECSIEELYLRSRDMGEVSLLD